MREFKKRRSLASELLRVSLGVVGILALGAVLFVASRASWDMYGKFASAAAARASAEAQVVDLEARHQKIEQDVEDFSSDRGVEAAVRERYGVAKPGEGQIDIVRQATSSDEQALPQGLWERLWQLLFVW